MKFKLSLSIALIMLMYNYSIAQTTSPQIVTFGETISTSSGMVIEPFSLILPPEGYIDNTGTLAIELNAISHYALICIYKQGVIIEFDPLVDCTTNEPVYYDLLQHGTGNYEIHIIFSNGKRYKASCFIE